MSSPVKTAKVLQLCEPAKHFQLKKIISPALPVRIGKALGFVREDIKRGHPKSKSPSGHEEDRAERLEK